MNDAEKYSRINISNIYFSNEYMPIPYKPDTEDVDENGFINRYFSIKVNSKEVIEISARNFSELQSSPLYDVIKMKWKITAPQRNILNGNTIQNKGAFELNTKEIDFVSKTYPEIRNFLTNPLEFFI
jgi:hypothetical protein